MPELVTNHLKTDESKQRLLAWVPRSAVDFCLRFKTLDWSHPWSFWYQLFRWLWVNSLFHVARSFLIRVETIANGVFLFLFTESCEHVQVFLIVDYTKWTTVFIRLQAEGL